jgi:phosphate/sulfate permease
MQPFTEALTVANAVGPWVASYNTYTSGEVTASADTPIWILIVAGLLLGLGFWCKYPPIPTSSFR